jgi:hypothetical protein
MGHWSFAETYNNSERVWMRTETEIKKIIIDFGTKDDSEQTYMKILKRGVVKK